MITSITIQSCTYSFQKLMPVIKLLTNTLIGIGFIFAAILVKAEWGTDAVVQGVYAGVTLQRLSIYLNVYLGIGKTRFF